MDFKQARKERRLTLKQVAEASGYGIGTISDLERTGAGGKHLREKLEGIYGLRNPETVSLKDSVGENLIDGVVIVFFLLKPVYNILFSKEYIYCILL